MDLPSVFRLNGADYFLLTLEHMMLRRSGCGNICTLHLTLDRRLEVAELQQQLRQNEVFAWIHTLRLRGGQIFSIPRWQSVSNTDASWVFEHPPEWDLHRITRLFPRRDPPLRFDLVHTDTHTELLFTWHHALTDAHGAELLIQHLGGTLAVNDAKQVVHPPPPAHEALKHMSEALKQKEFLDEVSKAPFATLYQRSKNCRRAKTQHVCLRWTEAETSVVDQAAKAAGAVANRSGFYFAVTARALLQLTTARGLPLQDVSLPIPQDRRKRGGTGPLIGNQVTFLFYRIPVEALGSIKTSVRSLAEQGMNLMRNQAPLKFGQLMDISRYLPISIYQRMVASPSKGGMASFFFSDTGESLNAFTHFMDRDVVAAAHYPPNMVPPGLTLIFSKFQNRLQCTIAALHSQVSADELDQLAQAIRHELTTAADAD